jgi:hypothetical protein
MHQSSTQQVALALGLYYMRVTFFDPVGSGCYFARHSIEWFIRRSSRTGSFWTSLIQASLHQAGGFGVVQLLYACDFFLTDH